METDRQDRDGQLLRRLESAILLQDARVAIVRLASNHDGSEEAGEDLPLDAEHPINYRKAFAKHVTSPAVATESIAAKIYAYHYLRATATTSSGKPALWQNELSFGKPDTHEFISNVTPLYATPLVRGDRKAIMALIEKHVSVTMDLTEGEGALIGVGQAADAILSFSIQSGVGDREPTPDMRIAGGIAWAEALKTAETYVDCADACWKAMWDAR